MTERLIKGGAQVNEPSESGDTSLMLAASLILESVSVIKVLLHHGAAVDQENVPGATALHFAVRSEDEQFIEVPLKAGALIDEGNADGSTALHEATKCGNTKAV